MNFFKSNEASRCLIGFLLLCSFAGSAVAGAMDPSHRADTWEIFLGARFTDSLEIDFDNGSSVNINAESGFGWGFAYNFNEKFALGFDAGWASAGYSADVPFEPEEGPKGTERLTGKLDASRFIVNGTYNFMASKFTPFVTGSLGWSFIDSNIASGPPVAGCWWDPWWGYVCNSYQPTETKTKFLYGGSVGLRFDVNPHFFLRGSVGMMWTEFSGAKSVSGMTNGRLEVGFTF